MLFDEERDGLAENEVFDSVQSSVNVDVSRTESAQEHD